MVPVSKKKKQYTMAPRVHRPIPNVPYFMRLKTLDLYSPGLVVQSFEWYSDKKRGLSPKKPYE